MNNQEEKLVPMATDAANNNSAAAEAIENKEQNAVTPNLTETQLASLDKSKYAIMAFILTNSSGIVVLSLNSEQDYKQGRWHYVPKDIPADLQPEFNNKKYCFEVYCTSDKNSQKRLKKLIKRFMPGVEVEFLPVVFVKSTVLVAE